MKTPTIILILSLVVGTRFAYADQMSPKRIEQIVNRIADGQNVSGHSGALLEDLYRTRDKDGVWNCQDRAELAVKLARGQGYHAIWEDQYGWTMPQRDGKIIGHRYVKIYDGSGKEHKILFKDYQKEKRKMLRKISK